MKTLGRVGIAAGGVALLIVVTGLVTVGYRFTRAAVTTEVYKERLAMLSADYTSLQNEYNTAVRLEAVTELQVTETDATLIARGTDGKLHRFDTPYKAGDFVSVEYVVLDGRLLIYGVYDRDTSPNEGVRVDPEKRVIDWSDASEPYTLAIGRQLDAGRWVVRVSGNGALMLAKAPGEELVELKPAPNINQYEPIEREVENATKAVSFGEVLGRIFGDE